MNESTVAIAVAVPAERRTGKGSEEPEPFPNSGSENGIIWFMLLLDYYEMLE